MPNIALDQPGNRRLITRRSQVQILPPLLQRPCIRGAFLFWRENERKTFAQLLPARTSRRRRSARNVPLFIRPVYFQGQGERSLAQASVTGVVYVMRPGDFSHRGALFADVSALRGAALVVVIGGVLVWGVVAAAPATAKRSPTAIYRALRTTPFTPPSVASRFSSRRRSTVSPSANAKRHRALGTVQVAFAKGQGAIRYTVFRSHADAVRTWDDDVTAATTPGVTYEARLSVPGLGTKMAIMFLGGSRCDPLPCKTEATFVSGVVQGEVTVTVVSTNSYYDRPDTVALTRAAYAHVVKLS